ncbi:hypothetical protein Leryth_009916 [Lithospermum erythrorhizon]|nr:hypothetical protein Leryth_009916 [Lithospermum erythrorhizon]
MAQVSDFGLTRFLNKEESFTYTSTLATLGYIAPEYGSEGLVSRAGDIYSFGILMIETFTKRKPSDEIFKEDLSLKGWVHKYFLEDQLVQLCKIGQFIRPRLILMLDFLFYLFGEALMFMLDFEPLGGSGLLCNGRFNNFLLMEAFITSTCNVVNELTWSLCTLRDTLVAAYGSRVEAIEGLEGCCVWDKLVSG